MHGGLPRNLNRISDVHQILRPTDIPDKGILCDLLWADPSDEKDGWQSNDRGVSFTFGADIVTKFSKQNDIDLICRAHQVVEDGYEFFCRRRLVTIFSAPNYCDDFGNDGALMLVDDDLLCSFKILKSHDGVEDEIENLQPTRDRGGRKRERVKHRSRTPPKLFAKKSLN